jgi:ribosome-binding factor A
VGERTARLDELLREEISTIVSREVRDPRIGFVTITDVEVTSDLRQATVWASIIGSETQRKTSLRALSNAMPFVRRRLGELRLRRIPELQVREDDSSIRGTRVLRLIEELEEGVLPDEPSGGETLPTPGPAMEPEAASSAAPATRRRRTRPGKAQRDAARAAKGARRPGTDGHHGR